MAQRLNQAKTNLEPPIAEVGSVFVFHVFMTGLSTSSHQVVYFMLSVTFWAIHFAHYFFTFLTLLLYCLVKRDEFRILPIRDIFPVCLSQFFVTVFTCLVHDVGSNGALFVQRLTDGIVIILVWLLARFFIPANLSILPQHLFTVIAFGIVSSFGWFESIISFRWSYLYLLPLLDISTAIHLLVTVQKYRKLNVSFITYMLNVTAMTSLFLLPLAILFTTDSVNKEWHQGDRVWESSDFGVLFMSYCGYTSMIYTKYWLMCKCTQETYLVARQIKYHIANYGQLFFRNFNVTLVSAVARPAGTILMFLYVRKRMQQHQRTLATTTTQNSNSITNHV